MEENKEQNDTIKNTDKVDSIKPLTPIINQESKSDKDNTESKYGTNSNQIESDNPERFTQNGKSNNWTIADKMGLAQTILNLLTFGATFFLILFAFQQNRISEDNYNLAKETFEKGEIDSDKRYKLDSINLNAQIQSLKEQVDFLRTQFEIENRSYLNTDFISRDESLEYPWRFIIRIYNIGKYPAKIASTKFRIATQNSDFDKQSFLKGVKETIVEYYVTDKNPFTIEINHDKYKVIKESVLAGKTIYFAGEVVYFDLATNEKRKMEFIYKSFAVGENPNMQRVKIDNYSID